MTGILSKILRRINFHLRQIKNWMRVFLIRLQYPDCSIKNSVIGRHCVIRALPGSKITINNSTINDGCYIVADHGGQISISNSFIGRHSVIVARNKIDILENCQIAEMVVIRDQNHKYGQFGTPIAEQGFSSGPIAIGPNVWLGAKVTVLEGTNISENTVVGAHSIASGILEKDSVYVGAIAKKIKDF